LRQCPRARLAGPSGLGREPHRRNRALGVAAELAAVRHACVRRRARLQAGHAVERGERGAVPPELHVRVADQPVDRGRRGVQPPRPVGERERFVEAVPGARQRGETAVRERVRAAEP
jgi:hypothetical protein